LLLNVVQVFWVIFNGFSWILCSPSGIRDNNQMFTAHKSGSYEVKKIASVVLVLFLNFLGKYYTSTPFLNEK